jgi:hypothetical protein
MVALDANTFEIVARARTLEGLTDLISTSDSRQLLFVFPASKGNLRIFLLATS